MPVSDSHRHTGLEKLKAPTRLLLGPGPSNAHPDVLRAGGLPQVGHLDPQFIALMEEVQDLMRYVYQTDNKMTVPVSGTGSAAMEAAIVNVLEPGEKVLILANGYFGTRMANMVERLNGVVAMVKIPWGTHFKLEDVKAAIAAEKPDIVFIVHAETSTGVCQPMDGIGDAVREAGALLIMDTVTSISGMPLFIDEWKVDIAYAGGQKCLNCPPGISPLTLGDRALAKLNARKTPVPNWYLDVSMLAKYWGTGTRTYHHTAPITMNYAMREALRLVNEEGLEDRWARHKETAEYLYEKLEGMGLKLLVDPAVRLYPLTTVLVPEGVDPKAVVTYMMANHDIEISGGLGELAGKVWRIGLMGINSTKVTVDRLITALEDSIKNAPKPEEASA